MIEVNSVKLRKLDPLLPFTLETGSCLGRKGLNWAIIDPTTGTFQVCLMFIAAINFCFLLGRKFKLPFICPDD